MKEQSLFVKFAGNSPFFAIMDFFLDNNGEGDYSKLDAIKYTGMSRGSLFKHWNKLEEYNIIKVTRKFGKTKLYRFNNKSPIARAMVTLEGELIKKALRKQEVENTAGNSQMEIESV